MVAVERRGTFWFFAFFVLLIVGGMCAIGYWTTYDIDCVREWSWTKFPPQFVCKRSF